MRMMPFSRMGAAAAMVGTLALAACVPPAPEPTPAPSPTPTPVAVEPPPPPPAEIAMPVPMPDNWIDEPQTQGEWVYERQPDGTRARYFGTGGNVVFAIACSRATGRILLTRLAPGLPANPAMDIRTETEEQMVTAELSPEGAAVWVVPAGSRFLDAIAFSRGRFAVAVSGADPLYLPAYPEITRVIEDCRA